MEDNLYLPLVAVYSNHQPLSLLMERFQFKGSVISGTVQIFSYRKRSPRSGLYVNCDAQGQCYRWIKSTGKFVPMDKIDALLRIDRTCHNRWTDWEDS